MIGKILLLINQYTMPYVVKKIPGAKTRFKVVNTKTGYVHSKSTTLKKAQTQVRLLKQLEKKKI
jgi:hypothetical protein